MVVTYWRRQKPCAHPNIYVCWSLYIPELNTRYKKIFLSISTWYQGRTNLWPDSFSFVLCSKMAIVLEEDSSISSSSTPQNSEVDSNLNQCVLFYSNEFNYISWSRATTLALGGRSKLGYVNGSIQIPPLLSPSYGAWLTKGHLVMSWLVNSMEPSIAAIFNYSESSHHLWKFVKEMYGNQNNSAKIFQLQRDITSLKQGAPSFVHHLGRWRACGMRLTSIGLTPQIQMIY